MQGHQNHALTIGLGLLQMLNPFDCAQATQAFDRPPPADGHFKKGHAGGGEVFLHQTLALRRGQLGKTQLQIELDDLPPRAGQTVHQRAQPTPQAQQHAIRQQRDQPQQAQAQPQQPEARMKKIGTKPWAFHYIFQNHNQGRAFYIGCPACGPPTFSL